MKLIALFLFGVALAYAAPHPTIPDAKLTPGAADPRVTQANIRSTIRRAGYTATVRNVPQSEKRAVMLAYGLPLSETRKVEFDHLISLEIGGLNSRENIWPQYWKPFPGARDKDRLENALRRDVCGGTITLGEAQRILATDWFAEYGKRFWKKKTK